MANSNKALSAKVAAAGSAMVPSGFEHNIKGWYAANRKRILALVGGQEDRAALFIASAFAQVNKIPQLLECKPETFYQCLIYSMGTNLLPGPTAECYYIPYGRDATFIPGYQGLVKLAYNGGFVTRITGHVVWEADEFDYNPATEEIMHRPFRGPQKERGQRIAAYVNIKNRFGENQPMVKYAEFIEGIKARSRGAKSKFSPWNSQYPSDIDAMWLKTVFKQAAKWIPKSATPSAVHLGRAIELDNQSDTGDSIAVDLLSDELQSVKEDIMEIAPVPENEKHTSEYKGDPENM
jgi:recombination protein RecT